MSFVFMLVAGCSTTKSPVATFASFSVVSSAAKAEVGRAMNNGDLQLGGLGYVQVESGSVNIPSMGAIVYRNTKPDKAGREVIVIVAGASPNIWQQVLPAAIGAGGYVVGNAVYGLSLDAARTIVTSTNSNSATAKGGSSSSSSNATGGASNNQNINNAAGDDVDACSGAGSCVQN